MSLLQTSSLSAPASTAERHPPKGYELCVSAATLASNGGLPLARPTQMTTEIRR